MKIVYKMTMFIVSTILVMLLVAYMVSHILGMVDREVATFVGVTLFCIYMACFDLVNDKTMWMKS
jgi:hypothetical protein